MKKQVLILFKTHLDVGFTDYSANILQKYLKEYIPNAIKVGYELKNTDTPFIWTVGSWLIWQALKQDADGSVERAVRDGILNWHALPFTTHTELMSTELFEYGLSLSEKLDARFGRTTTGAKMTDVPGHTAGMVPLMAKHGVRFLHLGVNPATPVPKVPSVFRWKRGDAAITVMYEEDYGMVADMGEFVVYFAHTNDNLGPQSAQEIVEIYDQVRKMFPEHELCAATLTDVAQRVEALKDLPVYEGEIGDTWIHGAQTDPQKMSRYRRVLRAFVGQQEQHDWTDDLLVVPEHTWGMDFKSFFHNDAVYTPAQLEELGMDAARCTLEASWKEQRDYVAAAERVLGMESEYPIAEPDLSGYEAVKCTDPEIELSWEIFDREDYERYDRQYMRCHLDWAIKDFKKPGLPDYAGGVFAAKAVKAYRRGEERLYRMEFDAAVKEAHGLPHVWLKICGNKVKVAWFGKKPSRIPQACWLKFCNMEENWQLSKLGQWISPAEILDSPFICGVDEIGVRNGKVRIAPLDSALVAPYGRRLLHYGEERGKQDLYFNLYNNIWNTNFTIWYGEDAMFRFEIVKDQK